MIRAMNPQFGKLLLDEVTQLALDWTREHHPERLRPPDEAAPPDVPQSVEVRTIADLRAKKKKA
jgi:hypothetical protein